MTSIDRRLARLQRKLKVEPPHVWGVVEVSLEGNTRKTIGSFSNAVAAQRSAYEVHGKTDCFRYVCQGGRARIGAAWAPVETEVWERANKIVDRRRR